MSEGYRLPAGVRHTVQRALEMIAALQAPERMLEEEREMMLDDLKGMVSDAFEELRGVGQTQREEGVRGLGAAAAALERLTYLEQHDARTRLREAAALLRALLA